MGVVNVIVFDISVVCLGFVYVLSMVEKMICCGLIKGLVIGGEILFKLIDWFDCMIVVLFGDGVGGVFLEVNL